MKYLICAELKNLTSSKKKLRTNFMVEMFDDLTKAAKRHEELIRTQLYRFVYISKLVTYQVNYSEVEESKEIKES